MASVIPSLRWQPQTGCLTLPPDLTILDLAVWAKQHKVLQLPVTVVDFADNQRMDSSVLALIVHWAVTSEQVITLHHCPSQATILIELYGLQELVKID